MFIHGRLAILLFGIFLFLCAGSLPAQDPVEPLRVEPSEWSPPDPASLSPDWWSLFATSDAARSAPAQRLPGAGGYRTGPGHGMTQAVLS
jgi:hypothetical protein